MSTEREIANQHAEAALTHHYSAREGSGWGDSVTEEAFDRDRDRLADAIEAELDRSWADRNGHAS